MATALTIGACAGQPPATVNPIMTPWKLADHIAALRAASCPEGTPFEAPLPIDFTATPVTLGDGADPARHLPNARFAGGWELTSADPNFGGLSGLDLTDTDDLLAVSDEGALFHITMRDGAPVSADIAYLRGANGNLLQGKADADSEGLALVDGLALVSFERRHRIEAFDLKGCGAAARAALVSEIGDRPAGMSKAMTENGGPEALAHDAVTDTLILGIETDDTGLPVAELRADGTAVITNRLQADEGLALTGLDIVAGTEFAVLRRYSPFSGNTIEIVRIESDAAGNDQMTLLVRLDREVMVDNFEGIAVQTLADGSRRAWIVSDNNFSDRQRTLLMAFDVN